MAYDTKQEMMTVLKKAIVKYQANEYLSSGGVPTKKRPIDKQQEAAAVELWATAVWIADDYRRTPHYWKARAYDEIGIKVRFDDQNELPNPPLVPGVEF